MHARKHSNATRKQGDKGNKGTYESKTMKRWKNRSCTHKGTRRLNRKSLRRQEAKTRKQRREQGHRGVTKTGIRQENTGRRKETRTQQKEWGCSSKMETRIQLEVKNTN